MTRTLSLHLLFPFKCGIRGIPLTGEHFCSIYVILFDILLIHIWHCNRVTNSQGSNSSLAKEPSEKLGSQLRELRLCSETGRAEFWNHVE